MATQVQAYPERRAFLRRLGLASGAVILMPAVSRCGAPEVVSPRGGPTERSGAAPVPIPATPPEGWDPIAFNRDRGNTGAIPASYLPQVNGPDGPATHLGKHLPYVPPLDSDMAPAGLLALMWGDPAKGHARHPNAVPAEANAFEGHWYDWIRLRKATGVEAEELESTYPDWPGDLETGGGFAVFGEGALTGDDGRNTIYLAAIPSDCSAGDWVRVHAHCLTHGEYVDFVQIPA